MATILFHFTPFTVIYILTNVLFKKKDLHTCGNLLKPTTLALLPYIYNTTCTLLCFTTSLNHTSLTSHCCTLILLDPFLNLLLLLVVLLVVVVGGRDRITQFQKPWDVV